MIHSRLNPTSERTVGPMIALAHCSKLQRILVAGPNSADLMFELHRRGYVRVATTTNCGLPAGQYDLALVDWRQRSIKALETMLDWLVDFLSPTGGVVVWLDPQSPAADRTLRSVLERHGLLAEAGTIHQHGSAVCARRNEGTPIAKVA